MKIRLLTSLAGRDFSYSPGTVIDVTEQEAGRLIDAGFAVLVGGDVERAVVEPAEQAVTPAGRRRGRR